MTAHQQVVVQTYRCPNCAGELAFDDRSWQCADCGRVPSHASD